MVYSRILLRNLRDLYPWTLKPMGHHALQSTKFQVTHLHSQSTELGPSCFWPLTENMTKDLWIWKQWSDGKGFCLFICWKSCSALNWVEDSNAVRSLEAGVREEKTSRETWRAEISPVQSDPGDTGRERAEGSRKAHLRCQPPCPSASEIRGEFERTAPWLCLERVVWLSTFVNHKSRL